jgi:hypothetical protein
MTPVVLTGRDWATVSGEAMTGGFTLVLVVSLLAIYTGLIIYKVAMPHLIERLSG